MIGEKKVVVVYKSRCGSTKKYAGWIAQALNADLIERSMAKIGRMLNYDVIIYGGCLTALSISGLKLLTGNMDRLKDKKIIIFAVGIGTSNEENVERLITHNFPGGLRERIRFFYFRGAFDLSKLNFLYRIMLTNLKRMIRNKKEEEVNEDLKQFLSVLDHPVDYSDEQTIRPLVELAKG